MGFRQIDWKAKLRPLYKMGTRLPPVVRSLVGCALIGGGLLGVLVPVLGFWMVPLGAVFIALDVPPARRRVETWLEPDERATSTAVR